MELLPPALLEPAALLPGYLRLLGQEQHLELRFGPEKRAFDPYRDGKRLQRGAGLAGTGLTPCRSSLVAALPGTLYGGGRIYAYRLAEGAVVAQLYSRAPELEMVASLVGTMRWTPPESWRQWSCLDLSFVSPPLIRLQAARLVPGTFTVTLRRRGSLVTLARYAPADVLLAGAGLARLAARLVTGFDGAEVRAIDEGLFDFARPASPWAPLSAIFPGLGQGLRGRIGHDRRNNRILVVIERGRRLPQDDYQRLVESYVATQQG